MLASDRFAALARRSAAAYGIPGARIVTVAHPIGGASEAELSARAEAAVDATIAALCQQRG